jgi:DNA-binding transcriptional LysR family regulator
LGITVQPGHLPSSGLATPRLAAPLPDLPEVQYVAVAARKLTPPAQTLLQILIETPIG